MRMDHVVGPAAQRDAQLGGQQRIEHEQLLVGRAWRLLAIGRYVCDPMRVERCAVER
jgi:hypothetical protein